MSGLKISRTDFAFTGVNSSARENVSAPAGVSGIETMDRRLIGDPDGQPQPRSWCDAYVVTLTEKVLRQISALR